MSRGRRAQETWRQRKGVVFKFKYIARLVDGCLIFNYIYMCVYIGLTRSTRQGCVSNYVCAGPSFTAK